MPPGLPLPSRAPSSAAAALLRAVQDFAAPTAGSIEDDLQRVSDLRHLVIVAEAAWEEALVHARESLRSDGALGDRVVENPTGGVGRLRRDTGIALSTLQDRMGKGRGRQIEARRREAFPA